MKGGIILTVRLQEGQEIELKDKTGADLNEIKVKLGWHVPTNSSNMFFANFFEQSIVECNAYMLMFQESSVVDDSDVISYCNPEHCSRSVRYLGKFLNNRGKVSELMSIILKRVPSRYDSIVFMADIDKTKCLNQHFGMISDVHIQIIDTESNQKLCQYDLTTIYDGVVSLVFGVMFRINDCWKFTALGEGSKRDYGHMIKQIRQFERSSAIAM